MAMSRSRPLVIFAVALCLGVAMFLLGHRAAPPVAPSEVATTRPVEAPGPEQRRSPRERVHAAIAALAVARPLPDAAPSPAVPDPHILKGPPGSGPKMNVFRELEMTPEEERRTDAVLGAFRQKAKAAFRKAQDDQSDPAVARAAGRELVAETIDELKPILGPERALRFQALESGKEPMTERSVRAWDGGVTTTAETPQ